MLPGGDKLNGKTINGGGAKPYTTYTVHRPRERRWPRVLLWSVVGVFAVAALAVVGSYVWLDRMMHQAHTPDARTASSVLENKPTNAGAPLIEKPGTWNIIIFGSDRRAIDAGDYSGEEHGRSDTIMIVHVDPAEDYVSVLSIPRDLRAEIPGRGVHKINAAYAMGGPGLAIETVRNVTNLDLDHYINIDFDAFREMTAAIGGVYVDVDRRYYHNKADSWENIDLQPGYQRLYGEDALDWVRFRQDANHDIGRIERQQIFMRAAKTQISGWDLAVKIPELVSLVAANTSTTLGTNDVLRLAWWGLDLDNSRIKQAKIYGEDKKIGDLWYVVASDESISGAVRDLMQSPAESAGKAAEGATTSTLDEATRAIVPVDRFPADLSGVDVEVLNANGVNGAAALGAGWLRNEGARVISVGDAPEMQARTTVAYPQGQSAAADRVAKVLGARQVVLDTSASHVVVKLGEDFKAASDPVTSPGARGIIYSSEYIALQTMVPFSIVGPTYMPEGYRYVDHRVYGIDAGGGRVFPALKTVYRWGKEDQYLGLMQTTFVNAPAAAPGEQVTENGITYTIVGIAGKVDYIWWEIDGVLYWVSNTISCLLSRSELLNVAIGMVMVQ
jgi:LCP family protein required for cell wall assembly